jgi:hypothetical protein
MCRKCGRLTACSIFVAGPWRQPQSCSSRPCAPSSSSGRGPMSPCLRQQRQRQTILVAAPAPAAEPCRLAITPSVDGIRGPGATAGTGRVLPATSLARAAAAQRTAGIQYPVAVGSVRAWTERSPRVDRSSERPPLMMYFHGSTSGNSSRSLPFHCPAQRITKRDTRPTEATHRLGTQQFTVSAAEPADRSETRMDTGLRTRDLPSTRKST